MDSPGNSCSETPQDASLKHLKTPLEFPLVCPMLFNAFLLDIPGDAGSESGIGWLHLRL